MEKTKFAVQVLLCMMVIPVLFIGTILGNDAGTGVQQKEHTYTSYTPADPGYANAKKRIARLIISCGNRSAYVKK